MLLPISRSTVDEVEKKHMPTPTMFAAINGVADTFTFSHQQGHDTMTGFQPGEDRLVLHGFSPHELRLEDHAAGLVTHLRGRVCGGLGANATEVDLAGVHAADVTGHIATNGDIWFG
jgi:hypothetical protein